MIAITANLISINERELSRIEKSTRSKITDSTRFGVIAHFDNLLIIHESSIHPEPEPAAMIAATLKENGSRIAEVAVFSRDETGGYRVVSTF